MSILHGIKYNNTVIPYIVYLKSLHGGAIVILSPRWTPTAPRHCHIKRRFLSSLFLCALSIQCYLSMHKGNVMVLRVLGWTTITVEIILMLGIIWWGDTLLLRTGLTGGAIIALTAIQKITICAHCRAAAAAQRAGLAVGRDERRALQSSPRYTL